MGHKFPVLSFHFDPVKPATDLTYAVRITNGDDGGGELFREEVQVVNGPPFIDYQFRFLNCSHKKYR